MTDILESFSSLQCELDVAKNTLKGVDENIKRLIGRDPSDLPVRPTLKKNTTTQNEDRNRSRGFVNHNEDRRQKNPRLRMFIQENEEPQIKKRNTGISVFKRLSDRPVPDDNVSKQNRGMISKVIVTPKEVPSRQERMEAQSKDATSVARNRRMFGALLGTLQKFQQEETKLKKKEDKRAQLEKKIEEHEIKEKEEIKKERQELFFNRKKKQAEIKMIELKMIRMKEYAAWEDSQKYRMNFILTKTKPQIHFLPRKLNDKHKTLLDSSKAEIQGVIDKKRELIQEELTHIEERGRRMFEQRRSHQGTKEQYNDDNDHGNGLDDEDINMDSLDHQEKEENLAANNSDILDKIEGDTNKDETVKNELLNNECKNEEEIVTSEILQSTDEPEKCERSLEENVSLENTMNNSVDPSNISNDKVDTTPEPNNSNCVNSNSEDCTSQTEMVNNSHEHDHTNNSIS